MQRVTSQTASPNTDSTEGRALGFLSRHEWALVGFLAALAFVLGCIGHAQVLHFEQDGGPNTWWDVVYLSLRLFVFEGPESTAGWPLHLQIARALAPMTIVYTAAKALWHQARRQVALYMLLFHKRQFVVVCGAGETGYRIARDYCVNSTMRVVVIDSDPMNPMAAELQAFGAIVLYGNAVDPLLMDRARVVYAKELFLCTGSDQANIAIAKNVERLARRLGKREIQRLAQLALSADTPGDGKLKPYTGLRCFLCVDTPDLYEVFANHPFFATNSERYAIRIFNRGETIARNVFNHCAPDLYYRPANDNDAPLHLLFIGFEPFIQELILQTALTCHYSDFRLPSVTVLCPADCRELVGRFLHRYPQLRHTMEISFLYADPLTITEQQWSELQRNTRCSVAYVALAKDVESILAARRLNRLRRLSGMAPLHFVVLLNQQTLLAEIIDDNFLPIDIDKSKLPDYEPIEYFETLDETITIDTVVNEALDAFAETLHNAYVETQLALGDSPQKNASLMPWSELPAHKKKANQHAAAHIGVKLRIAGYELRKQEGGGQESDFPGDQQMLDVLAHIEHRRWMADKYLAGYTRGSARDEDRMLHPDLIPWEELNETDRDKDRNNVRQLVNLAAMRGLQVRRAAD